MRDSVSTTKKGCVTCELHKPAFHRMQSFLFLTLVFGCPYLWSSETVLYSFTGGSDGGYPYAGLLRDAGGNLYGTTAYGGSVGCGVVFKVSSSGQETVLHSFSGPDGAYPWAGLILDRQGNLFGTTPFGGRFGYGTVFEITSAGKYKLLYTFHATDGASPYGSLVQDAKGIFYGTTAYGGKFRYGTVFKLTRNGKHKVLYSFPGGRDGASPYAGLVLDTKGSLYGTTTFGGASGNGTVFRVSAYGKEEVLHSFKGSPDGSNPYAGVLRDVSGNLYGTTALGGVYDYGVYGGTVFEITAAGGEKVLYSFCATTFCPDGAYPYSGLMQDSSGNLYGTTKSGGNSAPGVVFELTLSGTETVLYNFQREGADGYYPYAGLVGDSDGNLYGTTLSGGTAGVGTVFEVSP
jgi:uncharacterized repeat protein (TIGR03803 family)